MSKWKCGICGNEFENFHAQGFDGEIYCPLCYFKKKNQQLKDNIRQMDNSIDKLQKLLIKEKDNWNKLKEYIRETKLKEFEKSYGKRYGKTFTQAEIIVCNMILDKIQELEQGSDSNEKNDSI